MSEDFMHMLLICSLRKARQADPGMKAPDWGLQLRSNYVDRMDGSIELK